MWETQLFRNIYFYSGIFELKEWINMSHSVYSSCFKSRQKYALEVKIVIKNLSVEGMNVRMNE